MKLKGFLLLTVSLAALLSLISGCAGESSPGKSGTLNRSTIQKLMGLMPASAMQSDQDVIYFNDYIKIRQIYGISPPASYSEQDLMPYIEAMGKSGMAGVTSWMSGYNFRYILQTQIKPENVGYGMQNVDALLYHGYNGATGTPQETSEVISGSFNPSTTKDLFTKQENWPETAKTLFSTEVYNNITIFSWGDGKEYHLNDRMGPPCFDNLGRIRPFAMTENNILLSDSVAMVKSMIDMDDGITSGLTGQQQYADIAEGLTEIDVYSAVIVQDTTKDENGRKDTSQSPLLKKYLAYGTGIGKDDKGTYMAIVLANPNANIARDNVKLLQTRIENVSYPGQENATIIWKDYLTEFQVYAKENLVLAKLYTQNLRIWNDIIYAHPLIQHE